MYGSMNVWEKDNMDILRPNWVEIDLIKFEKNIKKLKRIIGKRKLLVVVKANAYGHGMVEISKYAEAKNLCDFFGVSSVEEGILLRENGIKLPILILGNVYPFSNFKYIYEYSLTPTISSIIAVDELIKYSKKINKKINIHLKLETGMNRIGASENTLLKMVEKLKPYSNIIVEGIYSHLSSADYDKQYTEQQIKKYLETISKINGFKFIKHIANSYASVYYPASRFDMVRCGIALYGGIDGFEQILNWKTRIVFIKYLKKGSYVSYSKSYLTTRRTKLATIPLGYGDGYLRALSNKGYVIVNGKKARICGNITMDMCMVDVTDIDCKVGDEVIVTSGEKKYSVSTKDLSKLAKTIPYEITTLITQRVPRIYKL